MAAPERQEEPVRSIWRRIALRLGLLLGVLPLLLGSAQGQQLALPEGTEAYINAPFGYRLQHPSEWTAQLAFENPPGPAYLIRQRVAFHGPQDSVINVDVWDRQGDMALDDWFRAVEGITTTLESNATISGQPAYVVVETSSCGVPPLVSTYVPLTNRIYKIHFQDPALDRVLDPYQQMLDSFVLLAAGAAEQAETSLPALPSMLLVACNPSLPNTCPMDCTRDCTWAAVSEGCCGYHSVPRWQCAKECLGSVVGDFNGNCVWWGAYTRRDVGALASGNAGNWATSVRATGQLPVDRTPKVGDIVVHPGSSWNHVAYVVWVSADRTKYRMSDMGWCADCGPVPEEAKLYSVDGDNAFIHCAGDPEIPTSHWQFTNCPFGWTPNKGFSASRLDGTAWVLNPAGDPYLLSPILALPAAENMGLEIRLAHTAQNTVAKVYFTTSTSPSFDETKSVAFTTTNDGLWHEYYVDMKQHPQWQGTITRLQVHPVETGNADGSDDTLRVAWIRMADEDLNPPSAPAGLQPEGTGWYGAFTRLRRPAFTWEPASDVGSGVAGYYVAIDDLSPDDWGRNDEWLEATTTWQVPEPLGEGERFVAVRAGDQAGNVGPAIRFSFFVDTTPPTNPAAIQPGCDAGNNQWQNTCYDPAFTWLGASDGDGSGIKGYHYAWGDSELRVPDVYTTASTFDPEPVAAPGGCATYFLNVATEDNLGQVGAAGPAFVLRYDGSPPPTATLTIDGGAATTNQPGVRLAIAGQDPCSGISAMRLSHDGLDWTEWLAYQTELDWLLPLLDEQDVPVYLELRDAAGNVSDVVSDTIYLDLYPEQPHSASFLLCASALDAGGGLQSSAGFSLAASIGQPWAGNGLIGTSYRLDAGLLGTSGGCPYLLGPALTVSSWPAGSSTSGGVGV
ncbi:MAG: CHAP domain-containing protein, partial [Anaerolineae bacterium]|nr:CHAP domain-containing protein [Anaerolineae bacterium]